MELAELQDQEVGDGTTSVVIVAAELLKRANELVRQRIHPTSIISGYRMAMREARPPSLPLFRSHASMQHACCELAVKSTSIQKALPNSCMQTAIVRSINVAWRSKSLFSTPGAAEVARGLEALGAAWHTNTGHDL